MSKLTLMKLPGNTWAATWGDEEAHNIEGDTNEDRLFNAAMVWGLNVDDIETEIMDNRETQFDARSAVNQHKSGKAKTEKRRNKHENLQRNV